MTLKRILFFAFMALAIVRCSSSSDSSITDPVDTGSDSGSDTTSVETYSITEGFEYGTKTAYAADSVTLYTGDWYFDTALIGSLDKDAKNDTCSARIKSNGYISTAFDVAGVTEVYVSHAIFGSDGSSTWQFLISTDGGTSYTQVGSDISESSTTLETDTFTIDTSSSIRIKILNEGSGRINIDDVTFVGTGDPGITPAIPDESSDDSSDDGSDDNSETGRAIVAGDDAQPKSGDDSNMLLGNPSDADSVLTMSTNYLIDAAYYMESYNADRAEPNWTSWHIEASDITSNVSRQDNFAAWSGLPDDWYQVTKNSYSGTGFNRGHNCPSGDRTNSEEANSATFLMTNMIPQAPDNNQQTWGNFEEYLRDQVDEGNEVYVIMGSYGTGGTGDDGYAETISDGNITVPSNVWKVAVILPDGDDDLQRIEDGEATVIAINTPNENDLDTDWESYVCSVESIETATGYDLLSNLSDSTQETLESSVYSE